MTRMVGTASIRPRTPARRWAFGGGIAGLLLALPALAPANWLADALAQASGGRLLLTDARGTLWSGSAVAVLTGGPGSRDASALPARLHWSVGLAPSSWSAIELALRQACCIDGTMRLRLQAGIGRLRLSLPQDAPTLARWPAAWLAGLGAPFNTLRLDGLAQLSSSGVALERVQGRWRMDGQLEIQLQDLSSALSTVRPLGSYRVLLDGNGGSKDSKAVDSTRGGPTARLSLQTLQGPLQLAGQGQWAGQTLRFRGQAQAEPGSEAMLNNLLNLLGQRQGPLALLAIG